MWKTSKMHVRSWCEKMIFSKCLFALLIRRLSLKKIKIKKWSSSKQKAEMYFLFDLWLSFQHFCRMIKSLEWNSSFCVPVFFFFFIYHCFYFFFSIGASPRDVGMLQIGCTQPKTPKTWTCGPIKTCSLLCTETFYNCGSQSATAEPKLSVHVIDTSQCFSITSKLLCLSSSLLSSQWAYVFNCSNNKTVSSSNSSNHKKFVVIVVAAEEVSITAKLHIHARNKTLSTKISLCL